jgi:hypothetical protein
MANKGYDLSSVFTSENERDPQGEPANVVDGLFAIAKAIRSAASHLGTGNAATPMGALEVLGKEIKEGTERIASAIGEHADAVRNLADEVARLNRSKQAG